MKVKTTYSIELIAQRKAEMMKELESSRERIQRMMQEILSPPQKKNNMELWMHYASTGMSTYNSIMTTVKLYQRIKGKFGKKKKQKSRFPWF